MHGRSAIRFPEALRFAAIFALLVPNAARANWGEANWGELIWNGLLPAPIPSLTSEGLLALLLLLALLPAVRAAWRRRGSRTWSSWSPHGSARGSSQLRFSRNDATNLNANECLRKGKRT